MRVAAAAWLLLSSPLVAAGASAPELLESLQRHGYVVLQGAGDSKRLRFVHPTALEELSRDAPRAAALASAWRAAREGRVPSGPLADLAMRPPRGLFTPAVASAAQALAALAEEWPRLVSGADGEAALFDQPWGRALATQTHADLSEDTLPLVKSLFAGPLAGPRPQQAAAAHFLSFCARHYKMDLGPLLSDDARRGIPSDELRAWLGRYLRDQRRLSLVRRLRADLAALEKTTRVASEIAELEAAARALLRQPSLPAELAALSAKSSPAGGVALTSGGLHVRAPGKLGRYELGDAVIASGAYWVDGVPEGDSVEIEETTFFEYAEGLAAARSDRVKRGNGGPYVFSRRITLEDSRPFVVRSVIGVRDGQTVSERANVAVTMDFEASARAVAQALQHLQSCSPKDADFDALHQKLQAAAKVKPQYGALSKAAAEGGRSARRLTESLARLEELVSDSRADAAPQQCQYNAKRTELAISLALQLPAGCGRYLPDLNKQLSAISRRLSDQQTFAKAADESVKRAQKCDFAGASDLAAYALALLDADPAARCGETAARAAALERTLTDARAAAAWHHALEAELAAAEKIAADAGRLAALRRLLARAGSLPSASCEEPLRRRAGALADAAGSSIPSPEQKRADELLSVDYHLSKAEGEVARERRKLEQALAADPKAFPEPSARWAAAAEEFAAPAPAAASVAAAPGKQPPEPAALTQPAGRPKIRAKTPPPPKAKKGPKTEKRK